MYFMYVYVVLNVQKTSPQNLINTILIMYLLENENENPKNK